MPALADFVSDAHLDRLIELAIDEDLGPDHADITTHATIAPDAAAEAHLTSRVPGVACGLALLGRIATAFDPSLQVTLHTTDGQPIKPQQTVAQLAGNLRAILAAERTLLNFVCHLCGIATLTRRYVDAVAGTKAKIYDTRKTLPGYRGLAKYAVACGGGATHRVGLYDAVLVKDNHLAHTPMDRLPQALAAARPGAAFVQVEVDTREQLERVLNMGVDIVLLDNMPPEVLREAVKLRDRVAPQVELEASGGVTLHTVRAIAESGVDRISVGALTHSAPALDLGLDIH